MERRSTRMPSTPCPMEIPLSNRFQKHESSEASRYIRALKRTESTDSLDSLDSLATECSAKIAAAQASVVNVAFVHNLKSVLAVYAYGQGMGRRFKTVFDESYLEEAIVSEISDVSETDQLTGLIEIEQAHAIQPPEPDAEPQLLHDLKEPFRLNPHAPEWIPAHSQQQRASERIRQLNSKAQKMTLAAESDDHMGTKFSGKEALANWFNKCQNSEPQSVAADEMSNGENILDLLYLADKRCLQINTLHILHQDL